VSDIEEVTQDVGSTSVDQPMVSDAVESSMDQTRQSPALSNMPAQIGQLVETKDVARLKQTVADLERRLKSRYCCRQDWELILFILTLVRDMLLIQCMRHVYCT